MSNRIRKGDRVVVHDDGPPDPPGEFPFKAGEHRMVSDVNGINHDSVQIEGDPRYWSVARFDLAQRPISADRDNKPIFAGDRVFRVSKVGYPQFEAEALSSPDVGPRKRTKVRRLDTGEEFAVAHEHLILVRHHWEPEDRMVKALRELRAAWETHLEMQRTQVAVVAELMTRAVLASVGEFEGRTVEVKLPDMSWEVASNHALGSARDVAAPTNWQKVRPADAVKLAHRTDKNARAEGLVQSTRTKNGKRSLGLRGFSWGYTEEDWEIVELIPRKPPLPTTPGSIVEIGTYDIAADKSLHPELHLIGNDWREVGDGAVFRDDFVADHLLRVIRDAGKDAS